MKRVIWFVLGALFLIMTITPLQMMVGYAATTNLQKSIDVVFNNIKIVLNGEELPLKDVNGSIVEPFIYNGTTYVPIRAVAEAFYKTVAWDQANSRINITDASVHTEQSLPISVQDLKVTLLEDNPLRDYKTISEVTTKEVWEKLGIQLFCFSDYGGSNHDIPYLANPCLIYKDGKLTDLPGLPGHSGLTGFNAKNAQFVVADLNQDSTYELLYTVEVRVNSYNPNYRFLYCYSGEYDIISMFGTDNYEYSIVVKGDGTAAIQFSSGEEAKLSIVSNNGIKYLDIALPDNLHEALQAAIRHSAEVKTHHLEEPEKMGLTLSQIGSIIKGMGIKEVYETLGLPQYFVGSGIISDGYDLEDGSQLIINYGVDRDYVQRAKIRAADGSETILIE